MLTKHPNNVTKEVHKGMQWIDAHCHVGAGMQNGQQPHELLTKMDALAVEQALIVPWDQAIAVNNVEGNNYVLDLAEKHPGRFIPFCTVNPWFGQAALDELERAVDQGAQGLKLHPVYQGFQLADAMVLPVIERAVAKQIPIYVATGTPVSAMPMQLFHIAERFPEGVFIQGHFGFPDFWIDAVPSVINVRNIYVDTAYNMITSIENVIKLVGAERVIFSSDAPYTSLENEMEKFLKVQISDSDRRKIGYENIKAILGKGAR